MTKFFEHFREDAELWGMSCGPFPGFWIPNWPLRIGTLRSPEEDLVSLPLTVDDTARKIAELVKPFAPSSMEW